MTRGAKAAPADVAGGLVRLRRTRTDKVDETRRSIFTAAVDVVGEEGYANASIAKIAARAQVAAGTVYNYFPNQAALFDQLLPALGERLLAHIRAQVGEDSHGVERELARIRAYFDFCRKTPGFLRILNEAEHFAPDAFRRHVKHFYEGYRRALLRSARSGELKNYAADEIEIVVFVLMGVRSYLLMMYQHAYVDRKEVSVERMIDVYAKLLTEGLFRPAAPTKRGGVAVESGKASP